jgi:hypothetical protein
MADNEHENNGTNNENPPANDPPKADPPAATPPATTPPATTPPPPAATNSNQDVITAINALPETIVSAMREALTPPKAPPKEAESNAGGSGGDAGNSGHGEPGKRTGSRQERFVKWWSGQ